MASQEASYSEEIHEGKQNDFEISEASFTPKNNPMLEFCPQSMAQIRGTQNLFPSISGETGGDSIRKCRREAELRARESFDFSNQMYLFKQFKINSKRSSRYAASEIEIWEV